MIAVIDYGVGNLFSLCCSLEAIGSESIVTSDPEVIRSADRIILPGVGAFGDAVEKLRSTGLDKVVVEQANAGKPVFGICLGMQLLFEKSYEYGEHRGLSLLKGSVVPMEGRIPQDAWGGRRHVAALLRRLCADVHRARHPRAGICGQ